MAKMSKRSRTLRKRSRTLRKRSRTLRKRTVRKIKRGGYCLTAACRQEKIDKEAAEAADAHRQWRAAQDEKGEREGIF
jgi:hypothetical protein